jgi:hypothetical protein
LVLRVWLVRALRRAAPCPDHQPHAGLLGEPAQDRVGDGDRIDGLVERIDEDGDRAVLGDPARKPRDLDVQVVGCRHLAEARISGDPSHDVASRHSSEVDDDVEGIIRWPLIDGELSYEPALGEHGPKLRPAVHQHVTEQC